MNKYVGLNILFLILAGVLGCDGVKGTKQDSGSTTSSSFDATSSGSGMDVSGGSGYPSEEPDEYPCSSCRYCATVASLTMDSLGNFVEANEIACSMATCDASGKPTCAVNEPKQFIASESECTRFTTPCPDQVVRECPGKKSKCGRQMSNGDKDCSESQFCNQYSGDWQCPYGYSTSVVCGGDDPWPYY